MDLFTRVAYDFCRKLTLAYSTSFGMSSRLFERSIRSDIYAIYALVRVADEIVDSFRGSDATKQQLLDEFERDVYSAIERQYSVNPTLHAFARTAKLNKIDQSIIRPFFESMRMDIGGNYTPEKYDEYIYGSAEVVGLMCLKVFCGTDEALYENLSEGARKLGSAYQKVNFLRDFAADYHELGRVYFPGVTYETFSDEQKQAIERDIEQEFNTAQSYIDQLPRSAQKAVRTSWVYYRELLRNIAATPVEVLKLQRVRIGWPRKLWLLVRVVAGAKA